MGSTTIRVPAISVGQHTYSKLLEEYKFGQNLKGFGGMPAAIKKIRADYDSFSQGAKRMFLERLNFDLYWPKLSERLAKGIVIEN